MAIGLSANQVNPEVVVNSIMFGLHSRTLAGNIDETLTEVEATNAVIKVSGTLTTNVNLIVPSQSKWYLVNNNTSGSYLFYVKTSGGTPLEIPQGAFRFVWCDGTNCQSVVGDYPSVLTNIEFRGHSENAVAASISSGAVTFDLSAGNFFTVSLTENITSISFSNITAGRVNPITIEFTQDATGGRTVTGWPAAVKWTAGLEPVITAGANAVDIVSGYTRNGGTTIRLDRAMENSS